MGRYYYGDIEGKFWFGVQSSDAADRFGVTGTCPSYIEYFFSKEDLKGVRKELKAIKKTLGDKLTKVDKFFEENNSYTHEKLAEALGVSVNEERAILKDYADYLLGKEIEKSIVKNGQCSFEGEL